MFRCTVLHLVLLATLPLGAQNPPTPLPLPPPIPSPELPNITIRPRPIFSPPQPPKDFLPPTKEYKPDKSSPSDQAKRLGIENPTKTTKFKTIRSEKFPDEYDIAIDEEAAKEVGLSPDEIEKKLKDALESRTDRRENNQLTIEITETKKSSSEPAIQPPKEPEKKSRLVGKIQKKEKPQGAHAEGEKSEKEIPLGPNKGLKIRSSGACKDQNEKTLEAFNLDVEV